MKKIILFFLLTITILFPQTYILTNDGLYKSFEKVLSGTFSDLFRYDNNIYLVGKDEILNIQTNKKIYVESPTYIGEGYIFSKDRLYHLKNDKLSLIRIISNISNPQIYKDILFAINMGRVVAYNNGKIIWTLSYDKGKINKIRISKNILAVFSTYNLSLFDISNPRYPKFLKKFNPVNDYTYNGYHVLLKNMTISFYDETNKLVFSKKVNGNKIITDSENIIVGNYLITKDFNITTYPFKIKAFVNLNEKIEENQTKFTKLWSIDLNADITGRPVAINGTLFLATTSGKLFKLSNGKILWNYHLPFIVTGHLTITENALVVPCWDDFLYSFDLNGNLIWKTQLDSDITLGAAYDGQIIYAVTDDGLLYEIKDGKIISTMKVGKWPISGPFVSLSGQIYTVDGMGYLWKNEKKEKFIGNIKNLAFSLENPQIPSENSVILIDKSNKYVFSKNFFTKNDVKILDFEYDIIDSVIGQKFIYILTENNNLYILEKNSFKILYKKTYENSKFIILDDIGNLYIVGKTITVISTNDSPSTPWNSIFKNNLNSSAVNY
ncbi:MULTISPECIES: PQQ-binding-like beta-propeller repeat protein [unclassified Thermosipho (in: thermotogales)]|uniref:outer membrane protein assembly factor BamB family protein n=1 Tax=unclassified Thermosipho (in: thermotogales) TaxID=2676525 RepID=UPI000985A8FD|nr:MULTISPECIES: PQQ-binding-like beta-propeller repeat protein [unclassified Thermosipho (in: thermotogales)]MBT1248444.1 pyrrolo-quinoline quinone [Thermosipho sp. 1244]OOC47571.1 pyrrolo-quinoline quinone [Thermosipho sp. 1223]